MKRPGKFYRKNEVEVMRMLGLEPTKNSGSGWVEKEDGQSEHIICQLKSTDSGSIRVCKKDIDTLQYNAMVSHKLPVFAIQFLGSNDVYLIVKPEELSEISDYIKTGGPCDQIVNVNIDDYEYMGTREAPLIRSSKSGREMYHREMDGKYKKKKKGAT